MAVLGSPAMMPVPLDLWRRGAYVVLAGLCWGATIWLWALTIGEQHASAWTATSDLMTAFTNLTTMLAGGVAVVIAVDPLPRPWVRVGLLTAMVMAIVTSVVNATLLDPALPSGAWGVVDLVQHYIVPIGLLGVWIVLGPRLDLPLRRVLWALAIPSAWLGMTLIRGAITDDYPYDFLDVTDIGYGPVLISVLGIFLAMLALASCLIGFDRVLAHRETRRA